MDDDEYDFLDDFLGGLGGMSFRRLTPLQGDLNRNYKLEVGKEANQTDLYWQFKVSVEYGDRMVCSQYARDYEEAVKCLSHMPKGNATIESFHSIIMTELREIRQYKYFYN